MRPFEESESGKPRTSDESSLRTCEKEFLETRYVRSRNQSNCRKTIWRFKKRKIFELEKTFCLTSSALRHHRSADAAVVSLARPKHRAVLRSHRRDCSINVTSSSEHRAVSRSHRSDRSINFNDINKHRVVPASTRPNLARKSKKVLPVNFKRTLIPVARTFLGAPRSGGGRVVDLHRDFIFQRRPAQQQQRPFSLVAPQRELLSISRRRRTDKIAR